MIIHRMISWPVNHHQQRVSTPPSFCKHVHVFVYSWWVELGACGIICVEHFWLVSELRYLVAWHCCQLCIWHCVITGIMAINVATLKSWETTITFFSCACGFVLGLPMTTEVSTQINRQHCVQSHTRVMKGCDCQHHAFCSTSPLD